MYEHTYTLKDGRTLSFGDYGRENKRVLFQFHGTPGSRIIEINQRKISESEFRIVTPERPGYGFSSPQPEANFEAWAADIQALADHLNIDKFHILGLSGGGPFALACAAYLPERVLSTTLVSTTTPAVNKEFWQGMVLSRKVFFWSALKLPYLLKAICLLYGHFMQWTIKRKSSKPSYLGEAFRQDGIGLETDLRLEAHAWRIPLSAIKAPISLWHGENDVLSPVAGAKLLAATIPNCETHFFPAQDHFLCRNAEINQSIENHLLSLSTSYATFKQDLDENPASPLDFTLE